MTERVVLVDSQAIAERGAILFPGARVVVANGSLPPEAVGFPDGVVVSPNDAWRQNLCAALIESGCAKVREWPQDISGFTERQQVLDAAGSIRIYQSSAPQVGEGASLAAGVSASSPPLAEAQPKTPAEAEPMTGSLDEPPPENPPESPTIDPAHPAWADIPSEAEESLQRNVRNAAANKRQAFEEGAPPEGTEWAEPAYFWGRKPLPPFEERWIFPSIRPFVLNLAAMVGCDPGVTYLQALAFASGCLSDDIKVRVRPNQDWAESARLWACVVGESGDGKSPSMRGIMRESRDLAISIAQRSKEKQAAYKDELDLWDLDRKAWLAKKQKGEPAGDRPMQPPKPVNEMLYFNGTTAEGLLDQQEQSTRGAMLYADEMLGWLNGMDQYKANGKGSDRQLWLSAWDGAEYVGILVGKLRTIPNTGVTIIGGSQPSAFARASQKLNLDQDGLMQRVLVYNSLGDANENSEQIADRDAISRWKAILSRLYHMKTHLDHCVFSESAHAIRKECDAWIASLRGVTGIPVAARQALSKWRAYLPRIALTLHAIEAADYGCEVIPATIDDVTTECAYAYMRECLWPHMLSFYNSLLDTGEEVGFVGAFANYVLARDLTRIKPHQLTANWSHYRKLVTIQQRKEFWARVEQSGWARPCGIVNRTTGIAQEYEINPQVWDGRFDEQIAQAKDQVKRFRAAMAPGWLEAQRRGRIPGED